jgi:hypothetical protein
MLGRTESNVSGSSGSSTQQQKYSNAGQQQQQQQARIATVCLFLCLLFI